MTTTTSVIRPRDLGPQVVWENTLDDTYRCYVLGQTDTYGYLRMERIDTGERVLDREVPISKYFRERDVLAWGDTCMDVAGRVGE
jgi:hypothetical protein